MALRPASELRTQLETPLSTEALEDRYRSLVGLIEEQAANGFYNLDITIGTLEQSQLKSWLESQGYMLVIPPEGTVGTTVRTKIAGSAIIRRVTWQTYSITPSATTVAPGYQGLNYAITAQGANNQTLYWRNTGLNPDAAFTPTQTEGTITLNDEGTATLHLVPKLGASDIVITLYYDQTRLSPIATAAAVHVAQT